MVANPIRLERTASLEVSADPFPWVKRGEVECREVPRRSMVRTLVPDAG